MYLHLFVFPLHLKRTKFDFMYKHQWKIRVSYADTDRMGYMYYGNYPKFYEVARVEALRNIGISYKELEDSGVILPVGDLKVKYIKPAYYDDLLTVVTIIDKQPGVKFFFKYEIYNDKEELINVGETTLVFVDLETGRPCKPTKEITEIFTPYFNE